MKQAWYRVDSVREAGPNIYILTLDAPGLAGTVRAGQFLNIKTRDFFVPLLRRPFSVHRVTGGKIEILFNIVGLGTQILAASHNTDQLDVLGPLGNHFGIDDDFEDAILVAGGLGVAPMPILTAELQRAGKKIFTFLGARDTGQVVREGLENLHIATDDGSEGHHGTVVDHLRAALRKGTPKFNNPKIFSCGPTPMLSALASLAAEKSLRCEVSLESPMACGIGICQGCPVELREGEKKYALVCKDGTVFPGNSVVF
jgi:dihydroorotate dehydrogenase electron transfer subunit